jgi:DsbC/DsbD-like thiol-disulfide interchange protein
LLLLAALALILGPAARQPADAGKSLSPTKVSATATKPDAEGRQTVLVRLEIEKGWHAYANPVRNEVLESNKTIVKIASKGGKLADIKIEYPPGEKKVDGKETYQIYHDKVTITAKVRRATGDSSPLDVTVQYVNCDATRCLPPKTVTLIVK